MRLKDQTAVVVGVGSTVGAACATTFAREGARVLAVDADEAVATKVAALADTGGRALGHVADLTSEAGAASVARRCEELWQRLDILMVCTSAKDWWSLESETATHWEEVILTNVMAAVNYTRSLRPLLRRSAAGSVVYLSSIDGIHGNPNLAAYSVGKGGLVTLTHVMAHVCGLDGIRVNCIAPGAIDLSGTGAKPNERGATSDPAMRLAFTPLKRHATAEDIALVALFFASADSAYVSGSILPVDGGRTALTRGVL